MGKAKHRASRASRLRSAKPWTLVAAFTLILGWFVVLGAHATFAQAPTSPTPVCGTSELTGPSTTPAGAVTVAAGDDSSLFRRTLPPNTTYVFATGTHTLGTGEYSQIDPGSGDTFLGAAGAVLSGQWDNRYAFANTGAGVTIEYLTIENFDPGEGEGAVNQGGGEDWTVQHDTIEDNAPGAGLMVGSNNVVDYDCLTENGEYGFDAYVDPAATSASSLTGGPSDITLSNNEISFNGTCNWEAAVPDPVPVADIPVNCKGNIGQSTGCGCSGGGKFWRTDGAVITDNDVHDNYDVGIWADTDNTGFDVTGNTFTHNWSVGYQEETSYNFSITGNAFTDNAWGAGPTNRGFPTPAIYVSESGGDSRVPGAYSGTALISGNTFTDNWSGVVLWQSSGRFCSDGFDAPCTLVDPSLFTVASCRANLATAALGEPTGAPRADYWDGCLWKTQNVHVTDNTFSYAQSDVPGCELSSNSCGENALFSQYGTIAPYDKPSPYEVSNAVSNEQGNVFSDNTYSGPWSFAAFTPGEVVTAAEWTAGFPDANGSGDPFGPQDGGSTFDGTGTAPTTLPMTTIAPETTTTTLPPSTSTTTTTLPASTSTTTTTSTMPPEQSVGALFQFQVTEGGTTFICTSQSYLSADSGFTAACAPLGSAGSGLTAPFKVTYDNGAKAWDCVTGAWSPPSAGWWLATCKVA